MLRAVVEMRGVRVVLRPYRLEDFEAWREVRLSNIDWLEHWEPLGPPSDTRYTYEEFARAVTESEARARADRGYRFLVWEDGELRGQVALNEISRGAFQNVHIGYWVDGRHAGRGLIPEAVRLLIGYAFTTLRLHRVQAAVIPRNQASTRVLEKVGMRLEGMAARYIQINGVWEDHNVYAITSEEWTR